MRINRHDTNGTKPLLDKGELGYDDYIAGGDAGRVYVGTGIANIAQAKKSEVDAAVVTTNAHIDRVDNPHSVTKVQVGLSNVDNTSDLDKPISTATQTALNTTVILTENQTVAGIKTFSSSPIVPTPTANSQVATKKYVDDKTNTFENISQLKLNSNTGRADVLGYYAKGDGGGGLFYWDSISTEEDNGGTIIQATGAATGRWKRVYSGAINVKWFGAKGDGVTDDTVALRSCHEYANSVKTLVSYLGTTKIAIDADAQITISTDVDFAECEIYILNGTHPDPLTWGNFDKTFIINDSDTPLITAVGNPSSADLVEGSVFPTRGIFDGDGYALLTCTNFTVPNRDEDGTQAYTQTFNVIRNGISTQPLSVNLSAYASTTTIMYRKSPKNRLTIEGINLIENGWNKLNLLNIQRNCVDIIGFTVNYETDDGYSNICNLIYVADCCDLTIKRVRTSGMPYFGISGTYILQISGGADIYLDEIATASGWGWIGTNNINGLYVQNSELNRVDGHSSIHNIFVDNSTLNGLGVVYGWGGGVIAVNNCITITSACIATRNDYGGCFYGDLLLSNIQVGNFTSATSSLIDMATQPVGASSTIALPRTINISNVTFSEQAISSGATANILTIAVKALASGIIRGIQTININNLTIPSSKIPKILIPYGAMDRAGDAGSAYSELNISNVSCANALDLTVPAVPSPAPSSPMQLQVMINNVSRLSCDFQFAPVYCFINGGIVSKAYSIGSPFFKVIGCHFRSFATATQVGGLFGTANETFTSIQNCHFYGNWNLSNVGVLQGNTLATGSTTVTLPATATIATAFSGWKHSIFPT